LESGDIEARTKLREIRKLPGIHIFEEELKKIEEHVEAYDFLEAQEVLLIISSKINSSSR